MSGPHHCHSWNCYYCCCYRFHYFPRWKSVTLRLVSSAVQQTTAPAERYAHDSPTHDVAVPVPIVRDSQVVWYYQQSTPHSFCICHQIKSSTAATAVVPPTMTAVMKKSFVFVIDAPATHVSSSQITLTVAIVSGGRAIRSCGFITSDVSPHHQSCECPPLTSFVDTSTTSFCHFITHQSTRPSDAHCEVHWSWALSLYVLHEWPW